MATFLYRLGRFSYRRRRVVGAAWLLLAVLFGVGASTLSGPTSDSFSIPGTESQEAFDLLDERFPGANADGASARVVFAAPEGETLSEPQNQSVVSDVVGELADAPQVVSVADPFQAGTVAEDGQIGFAEVTYGVQVFDLTDEAKDALFEAADTGRDAGLTVELGGDAAQNNEVEGGTEMIGIGIAAIVLVITFGSFIAAGMPLLTAILGIGIGISAITAASGFIDIGTSTPTLATMLGLAVGIDYALFIVSRYRHELSIGRSGEEAAGRAVGTAGSAVVFAGLTVMIALAGLSVVNIPMLTEMGLAAAFTVGIAVIIALSLLPALLGFAKHRVLGGKIPGLKSRDPESDEGKPTLGRRWAGLVARRPLPVLVLALAALIAVAAPVTDLRLGLPDAGSLPADTTQRKAYDLTAEGFGPGFNGPLMVVVDGTESDDPRAAAEQFHATLSETDGVVRAAPPMFNEAGDTAIINVVPDSEPSSAATEDLVHDIRDAGEQITGSTGAAVAVTGTTAINIDFSEKMADSLLPYLSLVVGLSFILLTLVFRSLLVPLKAAVGFLFTMGATFGAIVAVFQWGWLSGLFGIEQTGPIVSMLPIFLIGVVFGLAMDYQVFLVTRMREEHVHGAGPTESVVVGFQHGSRVVTAAAIIMIGVFSGFILSSEDFITQIGLAMAAAVAFDAFVVRMTVVPAVMTLLGSRAWYLPRWLDRLLPDVDVEGEKLTRYLEEDKEPELEPAPS
ncbi:RND superfamily putative drug exporter [Haloactinopolyspora alba]|uniref:RND superfamily putative drug exporter n=1 Tax=Haloactinopolyspora alba TaxID=648780 RepID=A0A2P8DVB7_9ACTN|nr:MMPL family transporter [Haloactinopolyspora alba]PSL01159.1 RND superfamily putative drug exporter [Haloactinopolyspora alba]